MDETDATAEPTQYLEGVLFRHGTLFDLDIGRWAAQKRLRTNDLLYAAETSEAFQLGNKQLLPPGALKEVKEVESKARSFLMNRSTPFPIGGGRFVSSHVLTEVLERLNTLKDEYHTAVAGLLFNYPELRNQQIIRLDKAEYDIAVEDHKKNPTSENWERLALWLTHKYEEHRAAYPTLEELATKFTFTWRMFQVEPSSRIEGLTEAQALEMQRAQRQLRGELQIWVMESAATMHKTLGEAALNAKGMLEKNGKLDPRNLRPIFEAFKAFEAMDFTGQSSFRAVVEQARAAFAVDESGAVDYQRTAESVSKDNKEAFNNLLATMSTLAQQETADAAGVRAIRNSSAFARVVDI